MKRALIFILKVVKYGLIVLATLLVMAVLALLVESYRGKVAWEKYKKEAEARGVGFDPRAYIPPPVPDDQNFAMTPLLKPLFTDESHGRLLSDKLKLKGKKEGIPSPMLGGIWEGKGIDLEKWKEYLGQPDVLDALKKYSLEMDEISAALHRPSARFPISYE